LLARELSGADKTVGSARVEGDVMIRWVVAVVVTLAIPTLALAQPAPSPEVLTPTVLEPVSLRAPGPLTPAEAQKERDGLIKGLKEDLTTFEPGAVAVRLVDGHWQVRTEAEVLKDFAGDRASATDAARLIHDLRVNQLGRIKGSSPPFEYWLSDGKPPRVLNSQALVMPLTARAIRAENFGGTWVVTDGSKGLYDFGPDGDAAKRAATVYWKHGFNQLAVIGNQRPTMICPMTDPALAAREKNAPLPVQSPLGVLSDVSRTSLLLPGNVYAGPKQAVDPLKMQLARRERGEIVLMQDDAVIARFGGGELDARAALRALQDEHVTEMARIGTTGFPFFLANGQPVHGEPLGATRMSLRADRLKIQQIRDTWWVTEASRPLVEAGTRDDAELLIKLIQYYNLRAVCLFGRPESGGLRLLTTGR
jgi:hypothetical protein